MNIDWWFLGHNRANSASDERPLLHLSAADASVKPGTKIVRENPRQKIRSGWIA